MGDRHLWPCQLPFGIHPGASPHCAPRDFSPGPARTWFGCLESVHLRTPVVTSDGYAILANVVGTDEIPISCVFKVGLHAHKMAEKRFDLVGFRIQVAVTPAIEGKSIFFATVDGQAVAINTDTLEMCWGVEFCKGCGADMWCIAANHGVVVMFGTDNVGMNFNDRVYALESDTGKLKWSYHFKHPSVLMTPSIASDCVVFMLATGATFCLKLADGGELWTVAGEVGANSWGGCALGPGGAVFVACNRKSKRVFNHPFGGKGVVRALSLKDGTVRWEKPMDLEANSKPAFLRNGPGGKGAVILGLGANPGLPEGANPPYGKVSGNEWIGRFVALDASNGDLLWSFEPPVWKDTCALGSTVSSPLTCTAWTNASSGADGTVYVGWNCAGVLYALDGITGKKLSSYELGVAMPGTPVVVPGMLLVTTFQKHSGWHAFALEPLSRSIVMRELEVPFAKSGTEHFWPCKAFDNRHLGNSPYKAATDISRPSWNFRVVDRVFSDWWGNTPVIDSQLNTYMNGQLSDLFVVRPDGLLRGAIDVGRYSPTVSLHGSTIFSVDSEGFAMATDMETFETKWRVRYSVAGFCDNWSICVQGGLMYIVGNQLRVVEHWDPNDGQRQVYALDIETGATKWRFDLPLVDATGEHPVIWNFTPSFIEELVIFQDYHLGLYCLRVADGSVVYQILGDGCWSTGNMASTPNGLVAITGNRKLWLEGVKTEHEEGVTRCYEMRSGKQLWELTVPGLSINQGPIFLPGADGKLLVAIPWGNYAPGTEAYVKAVDAETGEERWKTAMPTAGDPNCTESRPDYPIAPDSYGGMTVGADGTLYVVYQTGTTLAIEGTTGKVLSTFETKSGNNAQINVVPGMLVVASGHDMVVWRDAEIEEAWRQEAKDDPRAAVPWPKPEPPPPLPLEDPPSEWVWADRGIRSIDFDKRESWGNPKEGDVFTANHLKLAEAQWPEKIERLAEFALDVSLEVLVRLGYIRAPGRAVLGGYGHVNAAMEADQKKYVELKGAKLAEWYAKNAAASKALLAKSAPRDAPKAPKEVPPLVRGSMEDLPHQGGQRWAVVGGGKAGGIVVRKSKDTKSAELSNRLATGARVEEMELAGDRLHFRRLAGEGPDFGWVSLSFKGSPLLVKLEGDEE